MPPKAGYRTPDEAEEESSVFSMLPPEYRDMFVTKMQLAHKTLVSQLDACENVISKAEGTPDEVDAALMRYAVTGMLSMMSGEDPTSLAQEIAHVYNEAKDGTLGPVEFAGESEGPVGGLDED